VEILLHQVEAELRKIDAQIEGLVNLRGRVAKQIMDLRIEARTRKLKGLKEEDEKNYINHPDAIGV